MLCFYSRFVLMCLSDERRMGCTCSIREDTSVATTPPVEVQSPTAPAGNNARVTMYGASWCPWCKKQLQEFKKGRGKYSHTVYMCDTTRCDDGISTLPTLVLEADGRPTVRLLGYHTSESLERKLGV